MAKWPFNLFKKAEKTAENAGPTWLQRLPGEPQPANYVGVMHEVEVYNGGKSAKTVHKPVKKAAAQRKPAATRELKFTTGPMRQRKGRKSAQEVHIERLQSIVRSLGQTQIHKATGISRSILSRFANGRSNGSEETRRLLFECRLVKDEYERRFAGER